MVILDSSHRHHFLEMLKEAFGFLWTMEGACFHHIMWIDGSDTKVAKSIKLNQDANNFTAIVSRDTVVMDLMKQPVNFTSAFKMHYSVLFSNAKGKNIVKHTVSCNYLPTGSRGRKTNLFASQNFSSRTNT